MKIVVVSDSHGKIEILERIKAKHTDADIFIHCGDSELPPEYLEGYIAVQGNNDIYFDYPELRILNLPDFKLLVIHGQQFSSFNRKKRLAEKAISLGCKAVCYGHSHVYDVDELNYVHLFNPGSLRYNRDGSQPSYMIVYYEAGGFTAKRQDIKDL